VAKVLPELSVELVGVLKNHQATVLGAVGEEVHDTLDALEVGAQGRLVDV
jgi:hypothetical protein